MSISPFFQELRSAYQAELDDLTSDSEGKDVLRRRLNEKRKELGFLVKMIELSPEMVAVVLHQGFHFTQPKLMDHFLTQDADELLSWDALSEGLKLEPWAEPIAAEILKEPMGEWFMSVAAGLEYMHNRPLGKAIPQAEEDDEEDREDGENADLDDDEEKEARAREEAGNAWMVEQGFDSKE
ncbi:hypothetical protein [Limnohabitans sp.]|uniref:hypothetical protein n=1 Tax=Limnohabitans sp. TaxID=1907725 RepID=UPI00286F4DD8|nr:hypothetical protein [Limnohabitans sp.]